MVSTGVSVSDDVIHEFNNVINKHRTKNRFVIYKIENESVVVTEHLSDSHDFEEFLSLLPLDDCRYALYKTSYTTRDGRPGGKLVKISWAPSEASVRNKMIYAASGAALGSVLGGAVTTKLSVGNIENLTLEVMEEACQRFSSWFDTDRVSFVIIHYVVRVLCSLYIRCVYPTVCIHFCVINNLYYF